jgi:hypothetical protein
LAVTLDGDYFRQISLSLKNGFVNEEDGFIGTAILTAQLIEEARMPVTTAPHHDRLPLNRGGDFVARASIHPVSDWCRRLR